MQRLRHPINSIREPFGKAGLTVAICALVMAMVGGAYAAGGLTKSQEKQVTKIAKKFAGKPGAPGAAGTNGTNGTNGKDGTNGAPGAPGESVTAKTIAGPAGCEKGGSEFNVGATTTFACNGKNGTTGFTKTLPSGETETGTWAAVGGVSTIHLQLVPLSFNIPLEEGLDGSHVHFVTPEEIELHTAPAECSGTVEEPTAGADNLCVYTSVLINTSAHFVNKPGSNLEEAGSGRAGAVVLLVYSTPETARAAGSWAVTAE